MTAVAQPVRFLPVPDPEPRAVDVQAQLAKLGYKFASDKRGHLIVVRVEPVKP
jgi:hypothetical protein